MIQSDVSVAGMAGTGPSMTIDRVIPVRVNGRDVGPLYLDLGDDELAEWAARAEAEQAEILALARTVKEKSLELGGMLHKFIEARNYIPLDFDSAEGWMASIQNKLGFAPRWAWLLKRIYQVYIEKLGLHQDAVTKHDFNKLEIISAIVGQDPEGWLEKAKTNTRSELRAMVREAKRLPALSELFWDAEGRRLVYLNGDERLWMHGQVTWLNPGLSPEEFGRWVEDAEGHLGRLR